MQKWEKVAVEMLLCRNKNYFCGSSKRSQLKFEYSKNSYFSFVINSKAMVNRLKTFLVIALGWTLVACNSNQTPKEATQPNETQQKVEEMMNESVQQEDAFEDFPFILPSPLQIASIFKKSGLVYRADVTNSPANVTKYASKLSKSLNFGAYSADLSYCVLNNQTQEAMEYMKVVRQLADELGISNIFNSESLFESFERNIGVEDSLIDILSTIQEQLDDHLEESGQEYMSAIYFSGGWLEAMYIGSKVIQDDKKMKLTNRLVEQMTILDMIVRGVEYHPNKTEELTVLISDLKAVHAVYLNFEVIKALGPDGEIPEEGIKVTEDELNEMMVKIEEVRNKIING